MKSASSKTSTCFDGSRQKKKKTASFFFGGALFKEKEFYRHTHTRRESQSSFLQQKVILRCESDILKRKTVESIGLQRRLAKEKKYIYRRIIMILLLRVEASSMARMEARRKRRYRKKKGPSHKKKTLIECTRKKKCDKTTSQRTARKRKSSVKCKGLSCARQTESRCQKCIGRKKESKLRKTRNENDQYILKKTIAAVAP